MARRRYISARSTVLGHAVEAFARDLLTAMIVECGGIRPLARALAAQRNPHRPLAQSAEIERVMVYRDVRRYGVDMVAVRARLRAGGRADARTAAAAGARMTTLPPCPLPRCPAADEAGFFFAAALVVSTLGNVTTVLRAGGERGRWWVDFLMADWPELARVIVYQEEDDYVLQWGRIGESRGGLIPAQTWHYRSWADCSLHRQDTPRPPERRQGRE